MKVIKNGEKMERLNGFEMVDSNGCKLEVLVQNGIITVEYDSDHGRKVLFNEPTAKFASIADLTNELHEQNLEELEGAIWEEYTVTCPFCGETYEVPERPQVNGIDVGEWQALGVCNYLRETFRHECD